ncbi:MAG: response regulator [Ignavibacteriaceae bacterium]|nr:response regulator [Ignavibacteriaceae bacterium]
MNIKPEDQTILVVDDVPENIAILGEYLSSYRLKIATSGVKALEIAKTNNIDLVLLDIKMPGMDGYEVCRRLKKDPATGDIPVIFLSVLSEVEDKVKGFQAGAVDYITKPFQIDEVKSRIYTNITLSLYRKQLKELNAELEKKVEQRTAELIVAREKAEESSRLKSSFLALISHELRTPMSGILGFSEILHSELEDPVMKDYVEAINKSAMRLNDTLEAILSLSSYQSGKMSARLVHVNLVERIRNLIQPCIPQASIKNVKLEFIPRKEEVIGTIDPPMFDLILNNLLCNAVKYTNEGSVSVLLTTESRFGTKYDCITVSDTGIGIPAEMHDTIFDDFRQVGEGISRPYEGVGLGLSMVKRFTELHNGFIELKSAPGEGSEFKAFFPRKAENAKQSSPGIADNITLEELRQKQKSRILLIGKQAFKDPQEESFLKENFRVDHVADGKTAIELLQVKNYDLIISESRQALGMNEAKVLKIINNRKGNLPVIVFPSQNTALQEGEEIDPALSMRPKPETRGELLSLLEEFIRR